MLTVGRFFCQLEAQKGDDGAGAVGEVIQGIGHNRHRAGENTHHQLHCKQRHVAKNTHCTGKTANLGPVSAGGWIRVFLFHRFQ